MVQSRSISKIKITKIDFNTSTIAIIAAALIIGFFIGMSFQNLLTIQQALLPEVPVNGEPTNGGEQIPDYYPNGEASECGDGTCSSGYEDCQTCPQDCGQCLPEKTTKFEITYLKCDTVLNRLVFAIKNTQPEVRRETLYLSKVTADLISGDELSTVSKNARFYIDYEEEVYFNFMADCGNIEQIHIILTYLYDKELLYDDFVIDSF